MTAILTVLRRMGVDAGAGAPARQPIDAQLGSVTPPYTGPNVTEYQKQLALSNPRSLVVIDLTRFQRTTRVGNVFAVANQDLLLVTAPSQIRAFLSLRNAGSSAGQAWFAFDQNASDATADYQLPPGGFMFLDEFVPQGDLHVACSVAPTTIVVTYANATFNPINLGQ